MYIYIITRGTDNKFDNKIKISKLNLGYIFLRKKKKFFRIFPLYLQDYEFNYDNLINLCIMVKNGGDTFKQY